MTRRLLVTISREWKDFAFVEAQLRKLYQTDPTAVLVHGDCPQGDRQAAAIWKRFGGQDDPYPANWRLNGRGAGFIRNAQMVNRGADLCLAFIFAGSLGASDCADRADQANIPVYRFRASPSQLIPYLDEAGSTLTAWR